MLRKSGKLLKQFRLLSRKYHDESSIIGTTTDTESSTYQVYLLYIYLYIYQLQNIQFILHSYSVNHCKINFTSC